MKCVKAIRADNTELWEENSNDQMMGGKRRQRTFWEKGLQEHFNATFTSTSYSHHQKTIICDVPSTETSRRLTVFVGGLDITDGRWDTPRHDLFFTLLDEHKEDFYNKYGNVDKMHGPRQPWHDIHTKLEGPIAYDVFQNFIERWNKQGIHRSIFEIDPEIMSLLKHSQIDALQMEENESEWTCRIFRSITSDSAIFDHPKKLSFSGNRKVEKSILEAYVHMIRKAENFIYIENQYFYGSSHMWDAKNKPKCDHIIPFEIAQKIVHKIESNHPFVAYIVIPMFPEGNPCDKPLQEILYYQHKTMEMMYKTVADALKVNHSNRKPTDYLAFMCPAKREKREAYIDLLQVPGENHPDALKFRQSLRSPIYVHSKMMIVDDVYIIVGSANINQRSMAGTRDTEIAVGCWQEKFGIENPVGDVSVFRKSLFTEHFVGWHKEFESPASPECLNKMKNLLMENWLMYIGPEGSVMKGHMLPYPIKVRQDGQLNNFIGSNGKFPDFNATIAGKRISLNFTKQHTRVLC